MAATGYTGGGGGGGGAVDSVFGRTGNVTAHSGDYTAAQVGADATGTASGLVATEASTRSAADSALTTAVAGKAATVHTHAESDVTSLVSDLAAKAPINNPTFTGTVGGVSKAAVGLGNVDNTSDAGKPVSTAQQAALDAKAPLASPALTGTATAVNITQSGRHVITPDALTDAATIATDFSTGNRGRVTLGGNRTLGNPTNAVDGQLYMWELIQDATGNRTITLDTKFALGTDIASVTLSTGANKRDFLGVIYNSAADKFYVIAFVKGY